MLADNAPEKERDGGDVKWYLLILPIIYRSTSIIFTYFWLELLADHGPEYAVRLIDNTVLWLSDVKKISCF